jgi:hypothetical protein
MKSMIRSFCGLFSISGCLILLTQNTVEAQHMQWTWMHGDNYGGQPSAYGVKGVSHPSNKPGAAFGGLGWTDSDGNFWLYTNVLWKYSVSKNEWTWIQGDTLRVKPWNYGIKGVMHPGNDPGAISIARGAAWTDNDGNFWRFGGSYFCKNDLWRYSPKSNQWTWMHGDSIQYAPSRYGKMGIPDPLNTPGGRRYAQNWVDADNNLWLFGGWGIDANNAHGALNDLWKYDVSTNTWTWIKGDSTINQPPVYGIQGVSDDRNKPSGRSGSSGWTDANGNLWLVSGANEPSIFDDVWKFNPQTMQWTWMLGVGDIHDPPYYDPTTQFKGENAVGWVDSEGMFWMFGGFLNHPLKFFYSGKLIRYNPNTNQWTLIKSTSVIHNQKGVPNDANGPGEREPATGWIDKQGNLWLFGGYGRMPIFPDDPDGTEWNTINDLWKFTLCMPPAAPTYTSPASALNICYGERTTLSVSGSGEMSWYKQASGGEIISSGTSFQTPPLVANTTYYVEANTCTPSATRLAITVTVNPLPTVSAGADKEVCQGESVTLSGSGAASYSWDKGVTNGTAFTPPLGATVYTVTGTDAKGCRNTDQVSVVVNPLPVVSAGSDKQVCAGETVVLKGSGASGYSWDKGVSDNVAFTPPAGTTVYTVTGMDAKGCKGTDQVSVVVNALPSLSAGPDKEVCAGEKVILSGSGASTFSWDKGVANGTAFTPPAGTTIYTVTGTDAKGCKNSDQVSVKVNPLPNVYAGEDKDICQGSKVNLAGSGANTYSWDKGVTNGMAFTPPIGSTIYTVTGTDARGCKNTDQVSVTVHPLPSISAGADKVICEGVPLTLTGSGGASYTWNKGVLNGIPFNPPVGITEYSVTGVDAFGCSGTAVVQVTVIPSPDVTLTLPAIDDFCNLENSIPLSGGLPAGGVYSGPGVNAGYFQPKISGVGTHQISYTYTSGNGCSSTATAMMEVQLCTGGIEKDAEATAFSIFPNPGRGHYTLVLPGEGTVMIFNATGKVVMEKSGVSDLLELYLPNLSDGVYLLKFIQDSKVSSLKFIQKN